MVLTRHWDTCGSNPGVGGIFFFPFFDAFSVTPDLLANSTTVLRYQVPVC